MAVQLDACIQCTLCVRECRHRWQVNDVIGMAGRGAHEKIVFDFDDPMGQSTCVACGECVQACPTGALMPASVLDKQGNQAHVPDRTVECLCPYCGVAYRPRSRSRTTGCSRRRPRDPGEPQPALRQGAVRVRLCPSPEPAHDPRRSQAGHAQASPTTRSIPPTRGPTSPGHLGRGPHGRRAGFVRINNRDPNGSLSPEFGSAKGSNEEAYLFQKLVRLRLRHQQRRSLHPALPCLEHRRVDGDDRLENVTALVCCVRAVGRDHRHRSQPDG